MSKPLAVLIVEDSESDAQIIVRLLNKADYAVVSEQVDTAELMRAALAKRAWDIVISDYNLPQFDGSAALAVLQAAGLDIPFIAVSGTMGEEIAVAMMRAGAHDYLTKGHLGRLVPAVERELAQAKVREERRQADESIRISLLEKEILLKEIHHRVKNNLMIILGLIQMEGSKANNERPNPLLHELDGRIRAMALVHESLYKSADFSRVDLQNYIETMVAAINIQFASGHDIHLSVQAAVEETDINIAVPCGLILNELITNAFKHAFPFGKTHEGKNDCEIVISVTKDSGVCALTVADNGVGLPAAVDWENPGTLGLRLIQMLSKQINGTFEMENSPGAVFRLKFPNPVHDGNYAAQEGT